MVDYMIVKSLDEALKALNNKSYSLLAGGTDMMVQHRSHTGMEIGFKKPVMYLSHLTELKYIKSDSEQVMIGALTTLEDILHHDLTPQILKDIIIEMASPAIRHTGTLAGNIGNASPAGDSLVGLYLLDAKVKLMSVDGVRIVKVSDFILGVRKIDLKPNEMITEIIIPKLDLDKTVFRKVAPRRSDAISKMSFCAGVTILNQQVLDFRMSFGAVSVCVVRDRYIEEKYIGLNIDVLKSLVEDIVDDYRPLINPIDDQRSNKVYRKEVALNLIRDYINKL